MTDTIHNQFEFDGEPKKTRDREGFTKAEFNTPFLYHPIEPEKKTFCRYCWKSTVESWLLEKMKLRGRNFILYHLKIGIICIKSINSISVDSEGDLWAWCSLSHFTPAERDKMDLLKNVLYDTIVWDETGKDPLINVQTDLIVHASDVTRFLQAKAA